MAQTNKKILIIEIVEEDAPLRNVLKDKLIREGFDVLEAKNGKQGLDVALRNHPDLILLDILMPVMNGITMLKKLRKDAWGKNVKVIMLTNLSENEKVADAMMQGSHDYFVKSDWKIDDIVAKIKEKLTE